ncbi:cell division protein PerM [Cellulomonas fulva]|uniref:cell division protein PerM n=1 Tax=Cellulomonas fulva TaxID=2835530 RepID=UPI0027DDF2A4|nr:DUF6350 family protein [Cellulomonas fulva]
MNLLTTNADEAPPRARASSAFFVSALDGSPRWVTGALMALQGALLSLLVVVLPAVAAYVATSADPANEGVEWFRSVVVATALWVAGHGVPPTVGTVTVTVVPLGVTLLAVFGCWASARRSGALARATYVAGVVTYALVVAVLALLVGTGVAGVLRGLVGGALVAATGLGLGLVARPGSPRLRVVLAPALRRLPPAVVTGLGAATVACASVVGVAALLVAGWAYLGRGTVQAIADGLALDVLGGAVLAVAQLAFLPVLVVWAVSWLAGPGFAVGAGTHFAPDAMTGGTLPAVPLLGALPGADVTGGPAAFAPLVVVAAGALAGWWLHRATRRDPARRAWTVSVACVVAAATSGVAVALVVHLASGAIGPGRMATTGASALLVGAVVAGEVLLGALLVAAPADAVLRRAVATRLRSLAHRGRA